VIYILNNCINSGDDIVHDFNIVSVGERLREERKRLGFTQAQLADYGEVSRPTQYLYENAERYPSLDYLRKIHERGIDVIYVFCGIQISRAIGGGGNAILINQEALTEVIHALDATQVMLQENQASIKQVTTSLENFVETNYKAVV